jgi:hypothetical protein
VDDEAIGRARLDGSDVDSEFVKPTGGLIPYGVAADAGHVYWANAVNNAIGRATLGGGEIEEAFIPNAHPAGVAVDTEHVYWGYAIFGEAIGRANIDGSGVDTNFLPQGKAAFGLAAMAAVPAPAPGGGPSEDTQRPGNGPCAPVASSATTFVPTRKPGRVTPGVRAQITVAGGAALRIDATLVYRRNGKTHQASLGSRTVEASPTVKLRLPLPARLRALLPRGAKVRVKLKIAATAGACDPPSVSTHSFRATVVDVLK